MKNGYSIEAHESGRFIAWRVTEDNKYRMGSFETYDAADKRIEQAIRILTV